MHYWNIKIYIMGNKIFSIIDGLLEIGIYI